VGSFVGGDPMASLLLSALARMHRSTTPQEFLAAHPCAWLVWEPGTWKPPLPGDGKTIPSLVVPTLPPALGEALAFCLVARDGQVTLGRSPECNIEVNDATLSHLHLLLMEASPGLWTVRDAGSRNGSWMDGVPLPKGQPYVLRNLARLHAGQVCLTFYVPGALYERLAGFRLQTQSRLQFAAPDTKTRLPAVAPAPPTGR